MQRCRYAFGSKAAPWHCLVVVVEGGVVLGGWEANNKIKLVLEKS